MSEDWGRYVSAIANYHAQASLITEFAEYLSENIQRDVVDKNKTLLELERDDNEL